MQVAIRRATEADRTVVANLFELYLYDFSTVENSEIGSDGRYSMPDMLAGYWEDPQRHVFVITVDQKLAGFALVKRGSALAGDLTAMDLAEFFILRNYRRVGVGRTAAQAILAHFGDQRWVVRVLAGNPAALAFWEQTIGEYTHGQFTRETLLQAGHEPPRAWVIFRLSAPPQLAGAAK